MTFRDELRVAVRVVGDVAVFGQQRCRRLTAESSNADYGSVCTAVYLASWYGTP